MSSAVISFKRSLPRKNLQGQPAPRDFDPQNMDYLMGLAPLAVGPIGIGVVCVLLSVLFCCCRGVCNLCGSKRRNPRGYSRRSRLITLFVFTGFCVLVLLGSSVGLGGSAGMHAGIAGVFDAVLNGVADLVAAATNLVGLVGAVQAKYGGTPPDTTSFIDGVVSGTAKARDFRATALKYDGYRASAFVAIFALSVVLSVIGMAAGLLRVRRAPMCVAMFSVLFLFLLWLIVGVTLPLGTLVADACVFADDYIAHGPKNGSASPIDAVLSCARGDTLTEKGGVGDVIADGMSGAVSGLNTNVDKINSLIAALNSSSVSPLPRVSFNTSDALNEAPALNAQVVSLNQSIHALPPLLVPAATKADVGAAMTQVYDYVSLVPPVLDFLSCKLVKKVIDDTRGAICVKLLGAIDTSMAGSLLAALGLMFGVPLAILGNKRWPKDKGYVEAYVQEQGAVDAMEDGKLAASATTAQFYPQPSSSSYPHNPNYVPQEEEEEDGQQQQQQQEATPLTQSGQVVKLPPIQQNKRGW
jgi:hypothetical protein